MSYYTDIATGKKLPDRRSPPMDDVQQSVIKLIGKLETMESNIETKLDSVKERITNLDEKVAIKISSIEYKLDSHCEDEDDVNRLLEDHDRAIQSAQNYVEKIHRLETNFMVLDVKVNELKSEVETIRLKPVHQKANFIDEAFKVFKNLFFVALGSGFIAILWFLIRSYLKSLI